VVEVRLRGSLSARSAIPDRVLLYRGHLPPDLPPYQKKHFENLNFFQPHAAGVGRVEGHMRDYSLQFIPVSRVGPTLRTAHRLRYFHNPLLPYSANTSSSSIKVFPHSCRLST
jgi:hypothetical protein